MNTNKDAPSRGVVQEIMDSLAARFGNMNASWTTPSQSQLRNPGFRHDLITSGDHNEDGNTAIVPRDLSRPTTDPWLTLNDHIAIPDVTSISPSVMAQRESGSLIQDHKPGSSSQAIINMLHRQAFGFRPTYGGDVTNPSNRPQQVAPDQNCNLWITYLPTNCTEADIETAVIGFGSIWALSLKVADPRNGHTGTAASLAFTRIDSARELLAHAQQGRLVVHGQRARVTWNRNRIGPQPANSYSRVLVISGPSKIVNESQLAEFLGRYCSYRTTGIRILGHDEVEGRTTMEWRFARVSGQANIVASCLRALKDEHGYDVQFFCGIDPCEVMDGPLSQP